MGTVAVRNDEGTLFAGKFPMIEAEDGEIIVETGKTVCMTIGLQ